MKPRIEDLLIGVRTAILDAVRAIDRGTVQIALVIDDDRRLVGTVTDGDMRRGLLRALGLTRRIAEIMRVNPATVTVEQGRPAAIKLMRERKFHQVPVVDGSGRVVGLELIDDLVAQRVNETWVVVMAGGLGKRLWPLTETTPKPMLTVGGRPLLETIVRNLTEQGFQKVFIAVNYQRHVIQQHFEDGARFGIEIQYLVETQRLGTAGALSLLPHRPEKPLLVMNGDLMTSIQFDRLLSFHEEHGADATMCVREHVMEIPFGVVSIDGEKVTAIEEKPQRSCLVNAGIYILNPGVLDYIPNDQSCDMPSVLEIIYRGGGNVCVFPLREYWLDVGRMDDLRRAELEVDSVLSK